MRSILATFVVLTLHLAGGLWGACPAPSQAPSPAPPRVRLSSDEDYRVYEAYFESPFAEKTQYSLYENLGIYFIYNIKYDDPDKVLQFFKARVGVALDRSLVQAFISSNRSPRRIDRKRFREAMRYSPHFIQKDVYSLSRVGFNATKDEALFYASFSSLMEDGYGSLLFLKKTAGTWSVAKAAAIWMYGASVHPFNP
jgi:hypothetical protein